MSNQPDSTRKFVPKGWGYEDWIVNTPDYCGKVLFVKQRKQCSWHFHKVKDETFYVQSGEVIVRYFPATFTRTGGNKWLDMARIRELFFGEQPAAYHTVTLRAGESFHIPVGMMHQFYGNLDSTIIEFSTHHEDSDSHRVVDGDKIVIELKTELVDYKPEENSAEKKIDGE